MFNNANVIFRTKFVDGVSTVARTIGTGSSRSRTLTDINSGDDDDKELAKMTRRGPKSSRKGQWDENH